MSPDISMCPGTGCKVKETCYRYTATPGMRQSYFITPPLNEDDTCDYRISYGR